MMTTDEHNNVENLHVSGVPIQEEPDDDTGVIKFSPDGEEIIITDLTYEQALINTGEDDTDRIHPLEFINTAGDTVRLDMNPIQELLNEKLNRLIKSVDILHNNVISIMQKIDNEGNDK
jgi:hypothetical protein